MDNGGETTYETLMILCFNLKIHLYLCLFVNETKNPEHLDCGRSLLETHGDKKILDKGRFVWNFLSPIRRRYQSTTSRCSGFLKSHAQ